MQKNLIKELSGKIKISNLKNFPKVPLISVCIPVYDTEPYLERCLRSVITQDFPSFEVIIVSDASRSKDFAGHSAKKIVSLLQKESQSFRRKNALPSIKIKFIEHNINRGILEVRRTLAEQSSGQYIFSLDSDDEILPGTLSRLYKVAISYDIVHCTFISGTYDSDGNFVPAPSAKCGAIFYGTLGQGQILSSWLNTNISGNVCGKLIKRSLFIEAFKNIPYTECNMGDDILLFFFIGQFAKSYVGIPDKLYRYRINSGMSSHRKITSLDRWRLICSSSSVFTIISQWIKEHCNSVPNVPSDEKSCTSSVNYSVPVVLSAVEIEIIRAMTRSYLLRTLYQLEQTVVPDLKSDARQMLCDYWGESFVERMEREMK